MSARSRARTAPRRTTSRTSTIRTSARAAASTRSSAGIALDDPRARPPRDDRARRRHRGARLAPQAPGLLAASLGLSRMFADDHAMLRWGMLVYDALYAWCRDAIGETHGWNPAALRAGRREATARGIAAAARMPTRARGVSLLVPAGLHQLRRPGRTDRDHAPRARRRKALDLRARASCTHSTTACCCPAPRRRSSRRTSAG